MRRSAFLLLVPFAALLSACGSDNGTGPKGLKIFDCAQGANYQIGQTVSGSVANGDCTDPDGVGRADYYQFTLASAGPVAIRLENSSAASPRLISAILTSAGELTHFRYTSPSGSTTVGGNLAAGTYVIIVAATEDNQTSNYTLTSTASLPAPFDCHAIGALSIGTAVAGSFAASDCTDPFGYAPADYYGFTLASAQAITLKLTAPTGISVVGLADDAGTILDAASSTPSAPAVITVNVPAGHYYAIAAANDDGQTGNYTLESTTGAAVSAQSSRALSPRSLTPWSSRRRW